MSDLTLNGYTFDGWFIGDKKVTKIEKGSFGNVELTAKWTAKTYSASYYADNVLVGTATFTIEDSVIKNLPQVPQKNGYTGAWENYSIIAEDIKIYAVYTPITYSVTYVDDKNATNTNVVSFNVETETFTLSDLVCNGYVFEGWFIGDKKVTKIEKGSFGNVELTAKWSVKNYTITYLNVKTATNTNVTTYNIESEEFTVFDLDLTGYEFDGWYSGTERVIKIKKGSYGDLVLTAKWTPKTYSVLCFAGEELIGMAYFTLDDTEIKDLPEIPQKKGYTAKWEDYSISVETSIINAIYTANTYNVTFDYQGADGNNSIDRLVIGYDEAISLPAPTKTGYSFQGWYLEDTLIENGSVWKTDENVTLKAKWEEIVVEYKRVDESGNPDDNGNYFLFGSYPQSDVTNSMSVTLSIYMGTLPSSTDSGEWTSYGYYMSSDNSTDFMWYKDVNVSGEKYRAVYFNKYRPRTTNIFGEASTSYQDENGYYIGKVYWFKFEPIKWRILEESSGKITLFSEVVLDGHEYDNVNEDNDYSRSSIRKWLNNGFLNTAFSVGNQTILNTVTVDNSVKSTMSTFNPYYNSGNNPYACKNTQDKVMLLSRKEVTTTAYGFEQRDEYVDVARVKKPTAYAKCQGVYVYTSGDYAGNCRWWLRSPLHTKNNYAWCIHENGKNLWAGTNDANNVGQYVCWASYGVCPAIQIGI